MENGQLNKHSAKGVMCAMSKVELFDFQKEILDNTCNYNRVAYYLDMG